MLNLEPNLVVQLNLNAMVAPLYTLLLILSCATLSFAQVTSVIRPNIRKIPADMPRAYFVGIDSISGTWSPQVVTCHLYDRVQWNWNGPYNVVQVLPNTTTPMLGGFQSKLNASSSFWYPILSGTYQYVSNMGNITLKGTIIVGRPRGYYEKTVIT
jgi:hypothetical protein